ncbi:flavin-containing monooxygenase [Nocardiaceae bacterium NPDC056970]
MKARQTSLPPHVHTLVVGAGFGGIGLAATLLREDPAADLLVIERADDVGGTWRDNTYPGCACDVPSALYSYSFAPDPDWRYAYGKQREIHTYLRRVADETGVTSRTVTGCELIEAQWDAAVRQWRVRTGLGSLTATVLVAATGALSAPKLPQVSGVDSFTGAAFHSATWDHGYDLTGKRVAVIGTGASAIQFVPEIVDQVEHLTLFQRTASWVLPKHDRLVSRFERALFRALPVTQKVVRGAVYAQKEGYVVGMAHQLWLLRLFQRRAEAYLRGQVPDEGLRAALTPTFTITCKRILLSNDWLRTLTRRDVTVVASGLTAVTETGVVDDAGNEYSVDAIIFATGFTPTEPPVARHIRGADGRTLAEHWTGSPSAHLGTTVHGFPNLFLMYGPNTNLGHSSIVYMLESQAAYIADALRVMRAERAATVEVTEDAQRRYNDGLDPQLARTVWNAGGCDSWYLDGSGRNSVMWPTFTWRFHRRTRRFDQENYRLTAAGEGSRDTAGAEARA